MSGEAVAGLLPVQRVHAIRLNSGSLVRLTFQSEPEAKKVTVRLERSRRLVGVVRRCDRERPHVILLPPHEAAMAGRCTQIRRLAARLHRLASDPGRLSLVPRLPGPDSTWFDVQGTRMWFTANVPARWVTLYAAGEGEPVYVGQVARITDEGQGELRLGDAWTHLEADTGGLLVAAAAHVWATTAQAVRAEEVHAS